MIYETFLAGKLSPPHAAQTIPCGTHPCGLLQPAYGARHFERYVHAVPLLLESCAFDVMPEGLADGDGDLAMLLINLT